MPYFHISNGLRGCYMPDNSYMIHAKTRRDLKAAIQWEAESYRDAGFDGCNKRAIAHIAAIAWRNRRKAQLPYCLPMSPSGAQNYCHGVFVASATRGEYLEYCESEGM